jgi:hypothetical protein
MLLYLILLLFVYLRRKVFLVFLVFKKSLNAIFDIGNNQIIYIYIYIQDVGFMLSPLKNVVHK